MTEQEEIDERSLLRNVLVLILCGAASIFVMGFVAGYLVRGF